MSGGWWFTLIRSDMFALNACARKGPCTHIWVHIHVSGGWTNDRGPRGHPAYMGKGVTSLYKVGNMLKEAYELEKHWMGQR